MPTFFLLGGVLVLFGILVGAVLFWRLSLYAFRRHGLVVVRDADMRAMGLVPRARPATS